MICERCKNDQERAEFHVGSPVCKTCVAELTTRAQVRVTMKREDNFSEPLNWYCMTCRQKIGSVSLLSPNTATISQTSVVDGKSIKQFIDVNFKCLTAVCVNCADYNVLISKPEAIEHGLSLDYVHFHSYVTGGNMAIYDHQFVHGNINPVYHLDDKRRQALFAKLSPSQQSVYRRMVRGKTDEEIMSSEQLDLNTVKQYRVRITELVNELRVPAPSDHTYPAFPQQADMDKVYGSAKIRVKTE